MVLRMNLAPFAIIPILANCSFGQTHPSFEVASIRPHFPGQRTIGRLGFNGGPGTSDPAFLRCVNCTLSVLIREAYHLGFHQLPNFADPGAFFDLSATIPSGATKQQERLMLQSLLAPDSVTFDKDGFVNQPPAPPDGRIEVGRSGKSRIRGINEGTADLGKRLSFALNRPIIDRTGLVNKYDYALIFDTSALMPPPNPTAPDSDTPTPIEVLLQEQLGLRLEKHKGSIEILIVDHVDKTPTDN
jgi:Protein of unknown function (DUF3738)